MIGIGQCFTFIRIEELNVPVQAIGGFCLRRCQVERIDRRFTRIDGFPRIADQNMEVHLTTGSEIAQLLGKEF